MLFPTGLAKPKTRSSPISWSPRARGKSKRDRPAARTGLQSTISSCGSKKNLATVRNSLGGRRSINNVRQKETARVDHPGWLGILGGHERQRHRRRAKTNL